MNERNNSQIRKQVEVAKDDYEWFLSKHPKASLSWIVNILLQEYREVCSAANVTVKDVAHIVGENVNEKLEESVIE